MNEPTEAPKDASDAQAGEPTIDVELRNMPAMALDVGGATSTEGLVGVIRGWIADQRQTNEDVRAAFLNERLAEVSALVAVGVPVPRISGNPAEIEDLGRRLWAKAEENQLQLRPPGALAGVRPAVILNDANPGSVMLVYKQGRPSVAAEIDAKVAAGDSLVCAEMARLLADAAERAARLRAQYPDGLLFGPLLDQKKAPDWLNELLARVAAKNLTMVEVEDLPSGWVDPGLAYRVHLALVWPEVEAGWRQAQENQRKAQTELSRLHRESATAFAKEQTHGLGLTGAELESLAGLLAERDLRALGSNPELASLETMRAAAASNPLMRDALAAYEKWTANKCKPSGDQNDLTWRMGFAFHWPEVLREWLTASAEKLAARAALLSAANQEKNPDALAAEPAAEGRLEQAVRELMPSATKAVRVPPREGLEALGGKSMFALDAALADFIAGLTLNGAREAANDWREKWRADWSQARTPGEPACWERWTDPLRIPRVLARVLWTLKVRPELDRERSEIPILALAVVRDLAESHWAPNRQLVLFDGRAVLRRDGVELAEVPLLDPGDFEAMQRGAERLRSVTGQRVIRHLAREAYELHKATPGRADVVIEGGFSGLAEALGERSKKAPETVRDVLRAGQEFKRRWANGSEIGGLWLYRNEVSEARGRRALLVVTVGTVLRPYFALSHLPAGERFGVPVLPMPSFVGNERGWAAQAVFQFLLEAELVARRLELVKEGGAKLTPADFERLAVKAGLPRGSWPKVLDRWTQDGDDGPAMLERVGTERFTLADREPYKAAREWLLQGGRISAEGRQRRAQAKKGARRRGK